jgi:hypothetical protein
MKILDPGHRYQMDELDKTDNLTAELQFVKREGINYPGNVGISPGVTIQEVLRCCINRAIYINMQIPSIHTLRGINHMRNVILEFEERAAERHGRQLVYPLPLDIENVPICKKCGHIQCQGSCRE